MLFILLLLLKIAVAEKEDALICHPDNKTFCYPIDFEPEQEFKPVLPGQRIPKGLHVRLNFETGEKEAKLNIDQQDLDNRAVLVQKTATFHKEKYFKSKATLKDREQIIQFIDSFNQETADELLENLLEVVHDIDWSYEFFNTPGGFDLVLKYTEDSDPKRRLMAVWIFGVAAQNNPKVQKVLKPAISVLIDRLNKESDQDVLLKTVFAIGCLLRSNSEAINEFSELNGFQSLYPIYKQIDLVKTKVVDIMSDIFNPDMFKSTEPLFKMSKADADKWCSILSRDYELLDSCENRNNLLKTLHRTQKCLLSFTMKEQLGIAKSEL